MQAVMKTSPGDMLSMAGDSRVNENSESTSPQTQFVRENNCVAVRIANANPTQYG